MDTPRARRTFKHSATFTSHAKIVVPDEQDRFIAKASIEPLRGLLPAGVDPEANPDLLYVAANGAVAGMVNKNGDAVSAATALSIYRTCAAKYINTDHEKGSVVGVILYPGLSRYGTNEVLTETQAAALSEPFNISFAGVLWRVIEPKLARYLEKVGGDLDEFALSMSWEILFDDYSIGIANEGSKNVWDAAVVTAQDARFETLAKRLRGKGGNGKDESGRDIFRIIEGDAILLGFSIVPRPAAEVKGILPINEVVVPPASPAPAVSASPAAANEQPAGEPVVPPVVECPSVPDTEKVDTPVAPISPSTDAPVSPPPQDTAAASLQENSITQPNTRVTPNAHPMKITSIAQLIAALPDLVKPEQTVAVASIEGFLTAFEKANQKYEADLAASANVTKTLTDTAAAAETRAKELETSLATIQKQLDEVRAAQAAAEQNAKFQARMASFDEKFTLDDEDRQILASSIKTLDDTAFAAFEKQMGKLMAGKAKTAEAGKAPPFVKSKDKEDDEESEDCKAKKKAKAGLSEAFASITEIAGQLQVPAGFTADASLESEMTAAFATTVTVDGKTIAARRAEKLAAAPKE